jgi:hypothetical protein
MYWKEPLKPALNETFCLLSSGVWSIGSLMICEKLEDGHIPLDVVCSWSDGATYCLRKRSPPRVDQEPEGDFLASKHGDHNGPERGMWTISPNVFCKVKGWVEGFTTEATTIRWVNKNVPSVPTEEIIYDWIDPEWNRVIMITKRVPGETYQDAWHSLTTQQKLYVADQIAGYAKALSEKTSDYVETVQKTGLAGEYSLRVREALPPWIPRVEPRVSHEDYQAYVQRENERYRMKIVHPGMGEPLVLQHGDLNPTNFLVITPSNADEMPKVTGIIDWEKIGYLPSWQIATIPRIQRHFIIETDPWDPEGLDWQWMLSNACVRHGLPLEWEYAKEWATNVIFRHMSNFPLHGFINCDNLPTEGGQSTTAE